MRTAVIADIHGNADALDAVLRDIQRQGAGQIVVNGDVVNRGPDSVRALDTLLALPNVAFTLGNHDDLVLLWQGRSPLLPAPWFDDPFWGATAWTARELERAGLLDVPRTWPLTLRLLGGAAGDVLLCHGTPDDYRRGLSERTPPARVAEIAAQHGGPAVLVGAHIHRPADHTFGPVRVLNTGAVGSPADGDPRAAYLLLEPTPQAWRAELRRVPYDRSGVLRRFATSGLLDTGLSAEIFRTEFQTALSLYTPYWEWTEGGDVPRTALTWRAFLQRAFPGVSPGHPLSVD